jgi:hypothetical protein
MFDVHFLLGLSHLVYLLEKIKICCIIHIILAISHDKPPLQEKLVTGNTKQTIEEPPPFKEAIAFPPIFSQDLYIL